MKEPENNNYYDSFVRQARAVSFTDDQIDFLWDWLYDAVKNPEVFTSEGNFSKQP